jgi:hypothetical protein
MRESKTDLAAELNGARISGEPDLAIRIPHAPGTRRRWILLAALALVAILPRMALIPRGDIERAFDPNGDSSAYTQLADGLRHGCGFAKLANGKCAEPEANRTPGYPLFLVLCLRLRTALVFQAMLEGLIVLAAGSFVYLNWGLTAALTASLLIAFDLPSIVYSAELMTETIFTACCTLAILLALYSFSIQRRTKSQLYPILAASALLAFAVLTRPIAEFGLIVPALLVLLIGRGSWWRKLALQILLLSLPALAIVGWSVRNDVVAGIAAPSSIGATNLFYYRAGGTLAFSSGSGWFHALGRMGSRPQAELTSGAVSIIEHHPIAFVAMTMWSFTFLALVPVRTPLNHVLGLQQTFPVQDPGSIRLRDALASMPTSPRAALATIYRDEFDGSLVIAGLIILQVLLAALLWIGVIAGLALASIRSYRGKCILIFAGMAIVLQLLASGPEATARMRIPALPFLAIIAGIGWTRIATRMRLLSTSYSPALKP